MENVGWKISTMWFILGLFLHYVRDEGVHLTLHVFSTWLFPLIPPSAPFPTIPGARSGPVYLHLKWPPTFQSSLQSTFTLPKCSLSLFVCVCVRERAFVFKVKCIIVVRINDNPPQCSCTAYNFLSPFYLQNNTSCHRAPSYLKTCPDAPKRDSSSRAGDRWGSVESSWTEQKDWKTSSNHQWFGVSFHSSAALQASACTSTHTSAQIKLCTSFYFPISSSPCVLARFITLMHSF